MQEHIYEVKVEWNRDRMGELSSPVLNSTIECATPPQFPKGMPGIWSPEHLFAAAINSCFMTTFLAIAENSSLEFQSFSSKTTIELDKVDGKLIVARAVIEPELELIFPDKDQERAGRILMKSERACLISNSTKTDIRLKHKWVSEEI